MLSKLQKIEVDALKELNNYMSIHGLNFFLRGGSVMGSVKYKGFVPWDDDMDIAVPRKDYNKLIELVSKDDWSEKYWIASYRNGDDIRCYFPRLLLKEEFRKKMRLEKNNILGLTIMDILPLDGAPENGIHRRCYIFKVIVLRGLGSLWNLNNKETINIKSKKMFLFLRLINFFKLTKFFTQNHIYECLDKMYSAREWKSSKFCGTITGSLYHKEIVPTSWWGDGYKTFFEGYEVLIPVEYDKYLKKLYGNNYKEVEPDKNRRKSHMFKEK